MGGETPIGTTAREIKINKMVDELLEERKVFGKKVQNVIELIGHNKGEIAYFREELLEEKKAWNKKVQSLIEMLTDIIHNENEKPGYVHSKSHRHEDCTKALEKLEIHGFYGQRWLTDLTPPLKLTHNEKEKMDKNAKTTNDIELCEHYLKNGGKCSHTIWSAKECLRHLEEIGLYGKRGNDLDLEKI
ncbi:MAG: hypothetical protein LBH47_02920 [Christensenellaceae bacterium]|jgi:hypothetical protein|nr:hypothetical protein [Christensenellaceae bacterium]